MMETGIRAEYTARVNTHYMLFSDSCLEMFYYFVGDETITLDIMVVGEDLTPEVRHSVERTSNATYWQSVFIALPDGIYQVKTQMFALWAKFNRIWGIVTVFGIIVFRILSAIK